MHFAFDSILVISVSRTGSQLIHHNLAQHFRRPVTSTHDALTEAQDNQLIVLSRRQNTFGTIKSLLVNRRTNEYVNYTNKEHETFDVSQNEFNETYWHVKCHEQITQKRFPSAVVVDFEYLIADDRYLFSLFGVDKQTNYALAKKSPYAAEKLINNYSQLSSWFETVSTQPLTQVALDNFVEMARTYPWKPVDADQA